MQTRERKKYFIQQYMLQEFLHGGVGGSDAEKILLSKGFEPVLFPGQYSFSLKTKIARFFFLFKMILHIKRGGIIIFISPVYAKMNRLLLKLLRLKGVKAVCLIADIEGLRDNDKNLLQIEIQQYGRFSGFIVHNNQMAAYLEQYVPHAFFSTLGFFDFLVAPLKDKQRTKDTTIVFAANMVKSGFLEKLHLIHDTNPDLIFNLYGPGITETITRQQNVNYLGVFKPAELPAILQGAFGLIWDGESIDTCAGSYGEYLRYNSQHKLSLYIISSLPVIVWEGAATAELVKQYKIGLTVSSLHEIGNKINLLSEAEYRQMQFNMRPLAERISRGECLGDAINEIMKRI
jgi:hypothetical protein